MTFIEQVEKSFISYGAKFYGYSDRYYDKEHLNPLKSEDYITIRFDTAVFPQSITVHTSYDPEDIVITRVWGQTRENEWILLWEAPTDQGMQISGNFRPPIRRVQKFMRVFRIHLSHSLLQYRVIFGNVILSGYKAKFRRQDSFDMFYGRSNRKYDYVRWYLSELWLKCSLPFRNYNDVHSSPKRSKRLQPCNKDNSKLLPILPDEIILEIFNYLDLKSLCRCAQVNKRWLVVSQDASLYRELNLKRYWHKVNNAVLQRFIEICKRVRKLDLSWCGKRGLITETIFIEFLQTWCQNLTHLSLGYCDFVKSLALEEIGKCSNLKELRLRNCESRHYFPLAQLNRLTVLDLDCSLIGDEELIAILSVNPNLEHLSLDFCKYLKRLDDVMETVAIYNSKLITWSSLTCQTDSLSSVGIGHLEKCRNLRELDIGWCLTTDGPGNCLERISRGCKGLKRLVLPGFICDPTLTEDYLMPIIFCDKLILLDLRLVEKISKDFCELILASLPNLKLLDLQFGMFEKEQIAEWSIQYPNVVIQLYGSSAIPKCVIPNSESLFNYIFI